MPYNRGEVLLVDVPYSDMTTSGNRPAVVVSCDALNSSVQDITVITLVPFTGQIPHVPDLFSYEITNWRNAGLRTPSIAKPAIFTLESSRVTRRIGTLTSPDMAGVDNLLHTVLAL